MNRRAARAAVALLSADPLFDVDEAADVFDTPMDAAEALAYLCGFLVAMHAEARGMTEVAVLDEVRRLMGDDPGLAGVRIPRRPLPPAGPASERIGRS